MLIWTGDPKVYRPHFLPSRCRGLAARPLIRISPWFWVGFGAFLWAVTTVILRSLIR